SSSASEAIASSSLNLSPSGPREKASVQPTRSNFSVPLGASTTPSTEMYSVTTILPIGFSLRGRLDVDWSMRAIGPASAARTAGPRAPAGGERRAQSPATGRAVARLATAVSPPADIEQPPVGPA